MPLILRRRDDSTLPIDGSPLRADTLRSLEPAAAARLSIRVGNTTTPLGDLFDLDPKGPDDLVVLQGDLANFREIGAGMASGRLRIEGAVGPRLGAGMLGGSISVAGNAGPFAGVGMRDGTITIAGDAGHSLGAAEPGARLGMRDGLILVHGNVGEDAGLAMRRGLIAIAGTSGDGLGRSMVAGTIFAFGEIGMSLGRDMKRGTIALFRHQPPGPRFAFACRYRPPFVALYLKHLQSHGFPVPASAFTGRFARYNGDRIGDALGEVLVWER